MECPVDLLYGESVVKSWYTSKSKPGKSLKSRLLAAYLERHVNRMFAASGEYAEEIGKIRLWYDRA